MELLLAYLHLAKTEGEVKQTELLKKSGASAAQLKGLVEKHIVREEIAVDRIRYLPKDVNIDFSFIRARKRPCMQIQEILQKRGLPAAWCYLQW